MTRSLTMAAITLAATITPGPNNLAILQIAAGGDRRKILTAICAIVSGGLVLYALLHLGLETWVSSHPWAAPLLLCCSAACLTWLGGVLIYHSFRSVPGPPTAALVSTAPSSLALLLFQLVNPKGWALMASISAAARCAGSCTRSGEALPVLLLAVIPAASLISWHLLSGGARRFLAVDMHSPAVLRAAGVVLIVSALSLIGF